MWGPPRAPPAALCPAGAGGGPDPPPGAAVPGGGPRPPPRDGVRRHLPRHRPLGHPGRGVGPPLDAPQVRAEPHGAGRDPPALGPLPGPRRPQPPRPGGVLVGGGAGDPPLRRHRAAAGTRPRPRHPPHRRSLRLHADAGAGGVAGVPPGPSLRLRRPPRPLRPGMAPPAPGGGPSPAGLRLGHRPRHRGHPRPPPAAGGGRGGRGGGGGGRGGDPAGDAAAGGPERHPGGHLRLRHLPAPRPGPDPAAPPRPRAPQGDAAPHAAGGGPGGGGRAALRDLGLLPPGRGGAVAAARRGLGDVAAPRGHRDPHLDLGPPPGTRRHLQPQQRSPAGPRAARPPRGRLRLPGDAPRAGRPTARPPPAGGGRRGRARPGGRGGARPGGICPLRALALARRPPPAPGAGPQEEVVTPTLEPGDDTPNKPPLSPKRGVRLSVSPRPQRGPNTSPDVSPNMSPHVPIFLDTRDTRSRVGDTKGHRDRGWKGHPTERGAEPTEHQSRGSEAAVGLRPLWGCPPPWVSAVGQSPPWVEARCGSEPAVGLSPLLAVGRSPPWGAPCCRGRCGRCWRGPGPPRPPRGSRSAPAPPTATPPPGVPPPAAPPGPPPAPPLRGGALPALVRHLLEAAARGDPAFGPAFLGTFRAFARARDVLRLLGDRLEELGALSGAPPTPELMEAKAALSALLVLWLDGYPQDFGDPQVPPLARRLAALLGPGSEASPRLQALAGGGGVCASPPPQEEEEEEEEEEEGEGGPGGGADPLQLLGFPAREVAEQLTLTEAELFLRLLPYECLGALWSQRDKKGQEGTCPTVRATVRQFNRLAGAVVRSCLGDTGLRPAQRARVLEKWIRVAEECLALRNFSSLCAIVSALRSSPVHRLRQSWEQTSREAQRRLAELSALCSEQDNYRDIRRLLAQAGLAPGPPPEPPPRRQPLPPPARRGLSPYLGTFLRDLAMLDAAMKDELEDGAINFDKRRKEFAVLAQVSALQGLCRRYRLRPRPPLQRLLRRLRPLPEARSHSLSYEIEPPAAPPAITHRPEAPSAAGASSAAWDRPCPPRVHVTPPPSDPPPPAARREQVKWPSVPALEDAAGPPQTLPLPPPGGHRRSRSCGSAEGGGAGGGAGGGSECRILRVRMELGNGSVYKSVLVSSPEKPPAVVAKVLRKHGQDPAAAPHFQLLQLLPDNRELIFPPSANVFYAMSGASLDFALRPLPPGGGEAGGGTGHGGGTTGFAAPPSSAPRGGGGGPEFGATFPKIKATGRKITRAFF